MVSVERRQQRRSTAPRGRLVVLLQTASFRIAMRVKQSLPLVLVQYDSLILSVIAFKVQAGCSLDPNFGGSASVETCVGCRISAFGKNGWRDDA